MDDFLEKGSIVKISDGRKVIILNTPKVFLSGGDYEVVEVLGSNKKTVGKKFWLKPEDILFQVDEKYEDNINNYFEIIFDEHGLNIIPKNITLIELDDVRDDMKTIIFTTPKRKHEKVIFHIGDTKIDIKRQGS